jgi:acetolactate synthase-1/2/3 large subunit
MNIQEADVADVDVYINPNLAVYPAVRTAPEGGPVGRTADLLLKSKNPVVVAGAGVIRSNAWPELKQLAELLGCPVATSISGKGALAEIHPYSLGVIGSNGGLAYRHEFLKSADLIFYIGCHTGSVTTSKWTLPTDRSIKIIQLDIDPNHIGINFQLVEGIVADAKLGLSALIEEMADQLGGGKADKTDPDLISRRRQTHMMAVEDFTSDMIPIRPERFVTELVNVLPVDALVITDPGTPTPYMAAYYRLPNAGRWFVAPRAHGALGYSLPAVVGAYFARAGHRVVGIMGDGSFAISAGELETIARLNIPVVLIVLTNSGFGWVKAGQRATGGHYFGVDFSTTDHAKVARAYGFKAERVEDPADLNSVLGRAMRFQGPFLVDVVVQPLEEANAPVSKWVA